MNQSTDAEISKSKHKTIQEYINQNLQLKTLKIKKFQFQNSFAQQINTSRNIKSAMTTRQNQQNQFIQKETSYKFWQPKLSHRKIMNQPKVLLSVEKRKIKTSEGGRSTAIFSPPKSRLGFRGDKVRHYSFCAPQNQEKVPKKLIINKSLPLSQKSLKKVPNMHFNYKYIIDERKKGNCHLSVEQKTKQGSNRGYFACFGSQNFKKHFKKNLYMPSNKKQISEVRKKILYKQSQHEIIVDV